MIITNLKAIIKRFKETGSLEDIQRSGKPQTSHFLQPRLKWNSMPIFNGHHRYIMNATHLHFHDDLKSNDFIARQEFAIFIFTKLKQGADWLVDVLRTDETNFSARESMNCHWTHKVVAYRQTKSSCTGRKNISYPKSDIVGQHWPLFLSKKFPLVDSKQLS